MASSTKSYAGRLGGLTKASRFLPQQLTQAARAGFMRKFLREVDALAPGLPEGERLRRANALLRAHMCRLAMKSAKARRGR